MTWHEKHGTNTRPFHSFGESYFPHTLQVKLHYIQSDFKLGKKSYNLEKICLAIYNFNLFINKLVYRLII